MKKRIIIFYNRILISILKAILLLPAIKKRIMDITIVLLGLPFAIIASIFLCILIPIESPGNPFFVQRRVGRKSDFPIYKFRSMEDHIPVISSSRKETLENAQNQITTLGSYLRKWHLDEIPQVLNVILGHMSLVGPRALVPEQTEDCYYSPRVNNLLPGLTGVKQYLLLFNDEHVDGLPEADEFYAKHGDLWLDLFLICATGEFLVCEMAKKVIKIIFYYKSMMVLGIIFLLFGFDGEKISILGWLGLLIGIMGASMQIREISLEKEKEIFLRSIGL